MRTQLLIANGRLEKVHQELQIVSQNYSVLENKAKTDLADKVQIYTLNMHLPLLSIVFVCRILFSSDNDMINGEH